MKDFRGLDLEIGDRIAYATSSSSNVCMHEGIIVDIVEPEAEKSRFTFDEGRLKVLTNTSWTHDADRTKVVTLTRTSRVARLEKIDQMLVKSTF